MTVEKIQIGRWPSPIRRMEQVSETLGADVWVKHEDGAGVWNANKVRKLEWILGLARQRGVTRLISSGMPTSNWTSALAFYGSRLGFEVHVALAGRVPPDARRPYARRGVVVTSSRLATGLVATRSTAGPTGRRWVLPAGGSGTVGDRGSRTAGLEIAQVVAEGRMPAPARIFVACGTGGTAAGIGSGGTGAEVVAVRVAPFPYGRVRRVRKLARNLGGSSAISGEEGLLSPGYGRPNDRSLEAARLAALDGVTLDHTYAAKAFAALIAAARAGDRGPLLLLDTSPDPALGPQ